MVERSFMRRRRGSRDVGGVEHVEQQVVGHPAREGEEITEPAGGDVGLDPGQRAAPRRRCAKCTSVRPIPRIRCSAACDQQVEPFLRTDHADIPDQVRRTFSSGRGGRSSRLSSLRRRAHDEDILGRHAAARACDLGVGFVGGDRDNGAAERQPLDQHASTARAAPACRTWSRRAPGRCRDGRRGSARRTGAAPRRRGRSGRAGCNRAGRRCPARAGPAARGGAHARGRCRTRADSRAVRDPPAGSGWR